jgi:hypothetical protein
LDALRWSALAVALTIAAFAESALALTRTQTVQVQQICSNRGREVAVEVFHTIGRLQDMLDRAPPLEDVVGLEPAARKAADDRNLQRSKSSAGATRNMRESGILYVMARFGERSRPFGAKLWDVLIESAENEDQAQELGYAVCLDHYLR